MGMFALTRIQACQLFQQPTTRSIISIVRRTSRRELAIFNRKLWKWQRTLVGGANHQHGRLLTSTTSTNHNDNDPEKNEQDSEEYAFRHLGIHVHPDSISRKILPGNFVNKGTRGGKMHKRYTELVYGYFWMIKDLTLSKEKPIVSNEKLIPEKKAKVFPRLNNLRSISGETVNLPDFFLRKNRSLDVNAQCTLVAVSFRDFGYNLLPSWTDPFQEAMKGQDRVEVVRLNLSEGWFNKWFLRGFILGLTKRNTPPSEHDRTFLYFGSDLESFRDGLRMHNVLTGYVFLLDGLGRVRFAGSGPASPEEVERLIRFAKELTPLLASDTTKEAKFSPARRKGKNH